MSCIVTTDGATTANTAIAASSSMTAASTGDGNANDNIGASDIDKDAHLLLITAWGGVKHVCGGRVPFLVGIPDPKDFGMTWNCSKSVSVTILGIAHVPQSKPRMPDLYTYIHSRISEPARARAHRRHKFR